MIKIKKCVDILGSVAFLYAHLEDDSKDYQIFSSLKQIEDYGFIEGSYGYEKAKDIFSKNPSLSKIIIGDCDKFVEEYLKHHDKK